MSASGLLRDRIRKGEAYFAALDALVVVEAAEAASVRLGELTQPPWNELTPLVAEVRDELRAALAKVEGPA